MTMFNEATKAQHVGHATCCNLAVVVPRQRFGIDEALPGYPGILAEWCLVKIMLRNGSTDHGKDLTRGQELPKRAGSAIEPARVFLLAW